MDMIGECQKNDWAKRKYQHSAKGVHCSGSGKPFMSLGDGGRTVLTSERVGEGETRLGGGKNRM